MHQHNLEQEDWGTSLRPEEGARDHLALGCTVCVLSTMTSRSDCSRGANSWIIACHKVKLPSKPKQA